MFFQLIANAASLTVTTRTGKAYLFERGKPLKVDDRDVVELRSRDDLEECPEQGIAGRRAAGPTPKSVIKFNGPAVQPLPKPAPHEPTPRELGAALVSGSRPTEDEDE